MKSRLIYWHKARLKRRYILEMEIHEIPKSKEYKDGIKYRIIVIDPKSNKKVLMDNHHPKGPHIHIDNKEIPYDFVNIEKLIEDFSHLALKHMGVKL